jgi:peptidyl-prolyl cis-trans isomerase C
MKYLILLLSTFIIFACSNNEIISPESTESTLITDELLEYYAIQRTQSGLGEITDEDRVYLLDELTQLIQISRDATANELDQDPSVRAEINYSRLQILATHAINRHISLSEPSDEDLEAIFNENIEQFANDQYKARHILLNSEEEAFDVISLLNDGSNFAELAIEYSTGPSGPDGGDLGWFSATTMVEPFAQAVLLMEVGTHSDVPVETEFGFHVILLEDSEVGEAASFSQFQGEVTSIYQRNLLNDYLIYVGENYPISYE